MNLIKLSLILFSSLILVSSCASIQEAESLYKKGEKEGWGIITYKDGGRYAGDWKNDKAKCGCEYCCYFWIKLS